MAIPYPHSAVDSTERFSTQSPPSPPAPQAANTFTSSRPIESLLSSDASISVVSRDERPKDKRPARDSKLKLFGDELAANEERGRLLTTRTKRLKRLRIAKGILEVVIGSWAAYTLVRYTLAYIRFTTDQTSVALALAASTALSIALTIISAIISLLHAPLVTCLDTPNRSLQITRTVMHNFASIFLLIPAIVNLVLTLLWKNSSFLQFRVAGRCHFDVDVIWSCPASQCDGSHAISWKVWLASSILRLVLTIDILTIYHVTARAYHLKRRPCHHRRSRILSQHILPTFPETGTSHAVGPFDPLSSTHQSTIDPSMLREDETKFQSSAPRFSARPLSDASDITEADLMALRETPLSTHHSFRSRLTTDDQPTPPPDPDNVNDGQYMRPGSGLRSSPSESASPSNDSSTSRTPGQGTLSPVDPLEPPVSFVGGYIRRMPTIESLSSRELNSAGSSNGHKAGVSSFSNRSGTQSRLSTRSRNSGSPFRSTTPASQMLMGLRTGSEENLNVVEHGQSPTTSTYYTAMSSARNGSPMERTETPESIS